MISRYLKLHSGIGYTSLGLFHLKAHSVFASNLDPVGGVLGHCHLWLNFVYRSMQVAVSLAACIYFLNEKTKSVARASIIG